MAYDLAVWTNFNKNQKPLRAESNRYCKKNLVHFYNSDKPWHFNTSNNASTKLKRI